MFTAVAKPEIGTFDIQDCCQTKLQSALIATVYQLTAVIEYTMSVSIIDSIGFFSRRGMTEVAIIGIGIDVINLDSLSRDITVHIISRPYYLSSVGNMFLCCCFCLFVLNTLRSIAPQYIEEQNILRRNLFYVALPSKVNFSSYRCNLFT